MQKILILGSTGMLGSQVLRALQESKNFKIYATYKDNKKKTILKNLIKIKTNVTFVKFNVGLFNKIKLSKFNYIVNCIGIIKPYINEKNQSSIFEAINVNSLFPHQLITNNKKVKVFQIATDCVFDGTKGNYIEIDTHNPLDVYGKTKSLGEIRCSNFFNIRCSIIGPELYGHKSLLDWFKFLPLNSKIKGFKNHDWNGITTYAFGKIIYGIIKSNLKIPQLIHIVPKNSINKFNLLKIFKRLFLRKDIFISPVNSKVKINRTLKTTYADLNKKIWKSAGYKNIPTLEYLIKEIV
jgi:dTDP-4-dehydrorhamnose reductase